MEKRFNPIEILIPGNTETLAILKKFNNVTGDHFTYDTLIFNISTLFIFNFQKGLIFNNNKTLIIVHVRSLKKEKKNK